MLRQLMVLAYLSLSVLQAMAGTEFKSKVAFIESDRTAVMTGSTNKKLVNQKSSW